MSMTPNDIFQLQDKVADLERQNERARQALGDHERDREALERIEEKIDLLILLVPRPGVR
jgi:hypothetical protein